MSALPGTAVHRELAIHKSMLEASSHVDLTVGPDHLVATCTVCGGQRRFQVPACMWDVLDMMAFHDRSNH